MEKVRAPQIINLPRIILCSLAISLLLLSLAGMLHTRHCILTMLETVKVNGIKLRMKQGGLGKDILLLKHISNLPTSATLVQATVSAHLIYSNSFLTDISVSTLFFAIYL